MLLYIRPVTCQPICIILNMNRFSTLRFQMQIYIRVFVWKKSLTSLNSTINRHKLRKEHCIASYIWTNFGVIHRRIYASLALCVLSTTCRYTSNWFHSVSFIFKRFATSSRLFIIPTMDYKCAGTLSICPVLVILQMFSVMKSLLICQISRPHWPLSNMSRR